MTKIDPDALYLLADGTQARAKDCEPDADGVLRHIYGMPVALREDGTPMTIGEIAVENKNVEAAEAGEEAAVEAEQIAEAEAEAAEAEVKNDGPAETEVDPATGEHKDETAAAEKPVEAPEPAKDVTPEKPKRGYKTREAKAR